MLFIRENMEIFIICIGILLSIIFLTIGYILGKLSNIGVEKNNSNNIGHFKSKNNTTKNKVEIDNKKIVTPIKTNTLEKKYESLGDKKTSSENISGAIDKLKNIKK
jgi:hypothetical protein